jgi:hypothetical protein
MIPTFLASGIIFYGFIQLFTALIAVVLAVHWKKYEFLPGLFFLLLYSIIDMVDLSFITIANSTFVDVAQFGFILIAIIFFIIGMNPAWSHKLILGKMESNCAPEPPRNESLISLVKKI